MAWLILLLAGVLEVGWAIGLKESEGFTRPLVAAASLVAMLASVALLAVALRDLPLGTAYAVWTGIGAAGTVAAGIILFHEPVTAMRLACVGLILLGIAGLKLSDG
jgi:quaternary ammonium compound-resistance protein SugE